MAIANAEQEWPRLKLLSGFELSYQGEVVSAACSCQRLLAYLALHNRALQRVHVSGALWLDSTESRAGANLRSALWRTPSPGGHSLIVATSTHLAISSAVDVDFHHAVAGAGLAFDDDDRGRMEVDTGNFCADLLPDWYEDWVLIERERFRQLRLHALERICAKLAAAGRYGPALDAGLSAVAAEPLRESAHRRVIEVHLQEGNLGEALRQYRTYRRLLAAELGLEPSRSLQALMGDLPV